MRQYLLAAAVGACLSLAPPNARAAVSATLSEFTGADAEIGVSITPSGNGVLFDLTLNKPSTGDITGFWANVPAGVDLTKLSVSGSGIAASSFTGSVNDLGNGVNLTGGGSPGPLDFGVRFSKAGDGSGTHASFTLASSVATLTPEQFLGETFAARVQAIQGRGEGSSKLLGAGASTPPPPPPQPGQVPDSSSTAMLLGASLCGVEWLRRKLAR